MGFALIFYGLNLLTGGLKPLRNLPEVMSVISSLQADSFVGLIYCVLTAAGITAMIHSSSATIGIVMGLGAAGVLDWQTAVAFSLGADLGTTITSWMASLNLSKSAKRAAYAHISFNVIGVAIMLPLFFISLDLLQIAMQFFGGDPGKSVIEDGKESFPLVPVAVGLYSIGFNIFNTVLLFPFINVFERVLLKIGHTAMDDEEDYSVPRYLKPAVANDLSAGVAAIQQEMLRYTEAARLFLASARQQAGGTANPDELYVRLDTLNRSIRRFTSAMMEQPQLSVAQADLLASLIEEEDFTASLSESLYQMTRRVLRQKYTGSAQVLVGEVLDRVDQAMQATLGTQSSFTAADLQQLREEQAQILLAWRARTLDNNAGIGWEERGGLLALFGSAERAFFLADRLYSERQSVSRDTSRFAASAGSAGQHALDVTAAARA
jgi:phosphate:Na+ symporter